MKKMKSLLMLIAIAAASFTFTSCDDDPWDDGHYWHDDYGWYEDYNQGGWGWNQGDWNQGSGGSQNGLLVEEAQTLVGKWYGPVTYSYINDDGVSRGKDEFYATMIFYQSGNRKNALSGSGVEIDDVYDEKGEVEDSQTLEFTWYIDNNGDIYIRYAKSGATFVLDAGASQTGIPSGRRAGQRPLHLLWLYDRRGFCQGRRHHLRFRGAVYGIGKEGYQSFCGSSISEYLRQVHRHQEAFGC